MAQKYFSGLNYTLGNEDTGLEVSMIKSLKPKNIFAIAGCGSRALPLLIEGAEKLWCVDVAREQLLLTQLRLKTIESLSYEDFLLFWGFPPYAAYDYSKRRREIFDSLTLDKDVRDFFLRVFAHHRWDSLLLLGKWEKTFSILSKGLRLLLGKEFDKLFSFDRLDEQISYYETSFPMKRWKAVIFGLGNKSVFNALLYKGDFIQKNVPEGHFDYYFEAFQRLITLGLARKSFFMHLCFHGKITHPDGNTIEADREVFEACKAARERGSEVRFIQNDLKGAMAELKDAKLDFLSLSDVPSYFSGDAEKNFLQWLRPTLAPGAVVVIRYYLRIADADETGFVDITPRFSSEISEERVQMYRIKVLQYNA
jgi:S-adenosylmethionine-diacylglycerol 3-amino-3-carboxypropyl transferase